MSFPFDNPDMPLRPAGQRDQPEGPTDDFLVASTRGGDEAALRILMNRYDRLVRYTIYRLSASRAVADPQWIDSVAVSVWTGFVETVRKSQQPPASLAAFLSQVARNRTISAMRAVPQANEPASSIDALTNEPQSPTDLNPDQLLSDLEELEALRECVSELEPLERSMFAHLTAITERRWREAAAALGWSESTLRSRWKQTLERLKTSLYRKTGRDFAPNPSDSD